MALNEQQYILLTFIEQEYTITGTIVSKALCTEELGVSATFYDSCLKNEAFRNALMARGISMGVINEASGGAKPAKVISTQQMEVLSTILDRNDTRSDKKKLADLGVPTQTWNAWQRDPTFNDYYRRRAEALFGDMLKEAPRALQDNVARGDLPSIKLVYEMTGRWSEKRRDDLPIDFILMKVLEVLQKYITDPQALESAALELSTFTTVPSDAPAPLPVLASLPGRVIDEEGLAKPSLNSISPALQDNLHQL